MFKCYQVLVRKIDSFRIVSVGSKVDAHVLGSIDVREIDTGTNKAQCH